MSNQAYNEIYGARAMASNEPSQGTMLDQMRDRLAALSDEARSIRAQVPHEFEPDVERIQQQMQRLGERLSDLSRGALVPYDRSQRANEPRVKAVRYVTEEDMRVARALPNEIIPLAGPSGIRGVDDEINAWDEAAASALVELYESGAAYATSPRDGSRMGGARTSVQAVAARTAQQPLYASSASAAMTTASSVAPRGCAMDSNWLDQRFADIAARIEQSLAQIRPESALLSLGRRFDQLETQLNSILGHVATRADLDELRAAEAQIEEIANQLGQFRRQLARLDVIDAHLGTLTSQLSDERLTRLFNEGVQVSADVGRLDAIDAQLRMIAVQLSDERLSGLVSRSSARDINYEEIADAAAQRTAASFVGSDVRSRDIGEMRGMLECLINERRNSDENNASMLETMQQAIIRVLDRIDALELAQQGPAPSYMAPPAPATASAAASMPASYDDLVPPTATVYAEMPSVESDQSDFLPMADAVEASVRAYRQDAEADGPPHVPYTTASFDLDTAFSRSHDAEEDVFGEPQLPKRSMEVLRHDFIADAHRAKLKAASRPDGMGGDSDMRSGQLSVGSREAPAKPRRSIFSFRSQRVAMSLLVLLAAIPAAIFFMPRTPAPKLEALPAAATIAPAVKQGGTLPAAGPTLDEAPSMPDAHDAAPPAVTPPPPKQSNQVVPPLEQGAGEFEDVNATGAPVDTASLPDGITMQDNTATGLQLAQLNEQRRMAYLSGQLGMAAAKVTPAALMEEQVLNRNGGATSVSDDELAADKGASKLPPATVGPFSLRLAAAQGDASAQFEVASRLAEGKGTDQDLKEAALWYHRAAANGFAMAQFRLGTLYERGLGVKADPKRAQVWYERAAALGNVKSMHNLAVLAASRSPKGDYEGAARWFKAAADHGLADSQYNLAVLYENGLGVSKDMQQAYKWLLVAAKSGDKDAAGRRDTLKPKLSAADIIAAETQAAEWIARPMKGLANDARLAGQAWKDGNRRG
jgi:localization factor PodJL